ncbi:MAG TPA: NAD(P)-dependent oxidoreductase [Gaiellaceae bacterium]|nr:NAD(P)-dependent oxidoreductase [Gaiellaceae bacterium]
MEPRFLVTGAHGCVGAWVVHELAAEGRYVVTFDLSTEPRRLRLLLGEAAADVPHVVGDITDLAALEHAIDEHGVTHVIHLAALQVPLVRADPPLGARVNVLGTVNVFEAAARRELAPVVYASSIAAYDADGTFDRHPSTLYGVFKRANEATAEVYLAETGIASVGLRPHTVYGVGRDQGVTSAPTAAMLAAAAGTAYAIPYGGAAQLQLARDVARAFLAASLAGAGGAAVHNLPGRAVSIAEVVEAIAAAAPGAEIAHGDTVLPFPAETDARSFAELVPDFAETPLVEGVRETVARFRELLERGMLQAPAPAA